MPAAKAGPGLIGRAHGHEKKVPPIVPQPQIRTSPITTILLRFVGAVESRNRRREPDEGTGLGLTLTQCERQALIVSLEEYAHRATARLRAVARRAPARA